MAGTASMITRSRNAVVRGLWFHGFAVGLRSAGLCSSEPLGGTVHHTEKPGCAFPKAHETLLVAKACLEQRR